MKIKETFIRAFVAAMGWAFAKFIRRVAPVAFLAVCGVSLIAIGYLLKLLGF